MNSTRSHTPKLNDDGALPPGLRHGALWNLARSLTERSLRPKDETERSFPRSVAGKREEA